MDCALVYYYDAPVPEFRLVFGNIFAGNRYDGQLARLFPDVMFYDRGRFYTFAGALDPAVASSRLAREKCVYLMGSSLERFGGDIGIPSQSLRLVDRARVDPASPTVYQLMLPFGAK